MHRHPITIGAALAALGALGASRAAAATPLEPLPPPPPPTIASSPASAIAAHTAQPSPAYLTSTRIAAAGDGALAIDADSGVLVLVDAAGASLAQLAIARDAGLLAYDDVARLVYVADRRGDRIAVVRVGAALELARTWPTPAEPYGIALTPDRQTALVTLIADRLIVAYDVATGRERWRKPSVAEPRGIAVAPDGTRALVASLTAGVIDEIPISEGAPIHLALVPRATTHARGMFAVTFLGDDLAVSPFELVRPVLEVDRRTWPGDERRDSERYGGSDTPPVVHELALLGFAGSRRTATASIQVRVPRALAWDAAHDALYIAGIGGDEIQQITTATQFKLHAGVQTSIAGKQRCGVDGLAIAADGNLLVWCSFTRSVARVAVIDGQGQLATRWTTTLGPELAASALNASQHLGMTLFQTADRSISSRGELACVSCHCDGRADGLAWTIGTGTLQTPILAGRIADTAPYKWDGSAEDLVTSLRSTIKRLGGKGLGKPQLAALGAYLETIPAVHRPTRDPGAIARGKQVFAATDCTSCHDGDAYTDRARHRLAPGQPAIDTPSLIGIAASAPYFHDGSATTLDVLLRDRGAVHGMSEPARTLTDPQIADLTAFLESL
jgi:DNA-binding beta-propeller fold protein YncE/mono/diheme cytochrome c family protein